MTGPDGGFIDWVVPDEGPQTTEDLWQEGYAQGVADTEAAFIEAARRIGVLEDLSASLSPGLHQASQGEQQRSGEGQSESDPTHGIPPVDSQRLQPTTRRAAIRPMSEPRTAAGRAKAALIARMTRNAETVFGPMPDDQFIRALDAIEGEARAAALDGPELRELRDAADETWAMMASVGFTDMDRHVVALRLGKALAAIDALRERSE